jgi:hypothetical protein
MTNPTTPSSGINTDRFGGGAGGGGGVGAKDGMGVGSSKTGSGR